MLSRFFINRPIFASVISILIVLVGAMSIFVLPIAQYPDIVPPVVQVTASYPGADPNVIAETVAAPIEQQVNGVDNMLYMSSQSAADGSYTLNVTFALGTNIDMNTVLTQNRVSAAMAQLPEQVQRQGVTTKKVSSSLVMILTLYSPDGKYDDLFVTNYVTIYIKDVLSRVPGVGNINLYPSKDYSMRVWLDPDKLESRNLTVDSVVNAIKNQNVQVAAGQLGQPPVPKGQMLQLSVNTLGRLADVKQFEDIIVKTGEGTRVTRVKDVAQVELGGKAYDFLSFYQGKPAATMMIYQSPGSNAMDVTNQLHAAMEQLRKLSPRAARSDCLRSGGFCAGFCKRSRDNPSRSFCAGCLGGFHLPSELACHNHPGNHDPCIYNRNICGDVPIRILNQHDNSVWAGSGNWFSRGRRNSGC